MSLSKMADKQFPLVSVPVITYNSSKTVVETLESIYNQTYPNIELIVSDDCSTDDTVEICRQWIDEHKERFVRTELLTVKKNTGISGNCNRAESACLGEWVKGIAGDDLLMDNCIEIFVHYALSHPNAYFIFSRLTAFGDDDEFVADKEKGFEYFFFSLPKEEQLDKLLLDGNVIPAPTFFYNKNKFIQLGVINDERIPLLEDWIKWINMLKNGAHFDFIDQVLVKYRIGGISTRYYMSEKYYKSLRMTWFLYQYPYFVEKFGEEAALSETILQEYKTYKSYVDYEKRYLAIINSHAYKLGKRLLTPIKMFSDVFKK